MREKEGKRVKGWEVLISLRLGRGDSESWTEWRLWLERSVFNFEIFRVESFKYKI